MGKNKKDKKPTYDEEESEGHELGTKSHIGGPSEDRNRVRPGELLWVPALEKNGNFRLWYFKFRNGAQTYLSEDVYPDASKRRYGYLNALTRAADLGKNDALLVQLELYDSAKIYCDALLEKIKQKYMPRDNILRTKMYEVFSGFKREGKLGDSIEKLNNVLLECLKAGFEPDGASLELKYRSLLRMDELTTFELYLTRDNINGKPLGESDVDQIRRVMEQMAIDKEGVSKQQESAAFGFCGGAFNGQNSKDGKKRGKGKKDKGPRRQGYSNGADGSKNADRSTPTVSCNRCGRSNCKSVSTKNASDCYYFKQKCHECGATGHKATCCPRKDAAGKDNHKKHHRVHFADADAADADCSGADQDGDLNIPPGFQGCQPRV